MRYTYATPAATELALTLCRGSYQRALIMGAKPWSGAGSPFEYGSGYHKSRVSLLRRLAACDALQMWRCVEKRTGRHFITLNLRDEDAEVPAHPEVRDLW
jgi:hypothetical protein